MGFVRFAFLLVLLLRTVSMSAQLIEVRIAPVDKLQSFTYQALGDQVVVTTADAFPQQLLLLNTLEKVEIRAAGTDLELYQNGRKVARSSSLQFWCNDENPQFKLHFRKANPAYRTYPGQLLIRPGGRSLDLINVVFLEDYLRCVINAEAGHHRSLDFFKVQALSARTYALRNLGRHKSHGYDLCDNTHCQAYRGTFRSSDLIDQAVQETASEVIVFNNDQLIDAVFSANCGGFTANSEDVWIANVNYLRSMPDYDFCEGFNNHAWHLTVPKLEFLAKLGRYLKVEATSFEVIPDVSGRVRRVYVNGKNKLTISGEELRRLFRFKSARFHIYDAQSLLFIEGTGFGHGVGMCQDGAFYLSQMGMDYERIIRHYYRDVDIMKLDNVVGIW
ncbi:MAG TPA: SpoIID/LytB domain-containing protein [Bacteroidetes bacterium]|nr:SpoIID/LytB domain-containing protein [Bacteroidota bacterium]